MESFKAAQAALALAGNNILGRPIKIKEAPARPGDIWPPVSSSSSGSGAKPVSAKPFEGAVKLYIGNLSYEVDEPDLRDFFKDCGELKYIRWLTHRDSGEFKGCGFVDFYDTEAAEKAVLLNGQKLLDRPIRVDWDGGGR